MACRVVGSFSSSHLSSTLWLVWHTAEHSPDGEHGYLFLINPFLGAMELARGHGDGGMVQTWGETVLGVAWVAGGCSHDLVCDECS